MRVLMIEKFAALITAAFALVAALAWNDTIKAIFKGIYGTPDSVVPMLVYAIVITFVAVIATVIIGKAEQRAKEQEISLKHHYDKHIREHIGKHVSKHIKRLNGIGKNK